MKRGEAIVIWTLEGEDRKASPHELAQLLWTVANDYIAHYKPRRSKKPIRSALCGVLICDVNGVPLKDYKKAITWKLERAKEEVLLGDEPLRTMQIGADDPTVISVLVAHVTSVMQFSLAKDKALLDGMRVLAEVGTSAAELMQAAAELHSAGTAAALEGEKSAMDGALQSFIATQRAEANQKHWLDTEFGQTLAVSLAPTVNAIAEMLPGALAYLIDRFGKKL
jgi:hypothetical protein